MEITTNDNNRTWNVSEPLGNAVKLAQAYLAAKQELEKSLKFAWKEFRDERLQQEEERIKGELAKMKTDTMAAISAYFDDVRKSVAERQAKITDFNKDLRPELISKDFAFLTAPVTLTAYELQQLADRNNKNSLFTRAASEYAQKNGLRITTDAERVEALQQAANYAEGFLHNIVRRHDHIGINRLSIFIKSGHMEQLDSSLSGVNAELGLWDLDGTLITDDIKLLDGSIDLNADDLRTLLDRYKNNTAMTRAIQNYIAENKIDMELPEEPKPENEPTPEGELNSEDKPKTPADYRALYEKAKADKNQIESLRIKRAAFENGVEVG